MLPPAPRSALPWFTRRPQQTAEVRDKLRDRSSLTISARNAKGTRYSVCASYLSLSFSAAGYRLPKAVVRNNALALNVGLLFPSYISIMLASSTLPAGS